MKLHANAALSLTQRRRMVRMVVEQGWSIKAAAAEAETSLQDMFEVGGPVPGGIRGRVCWIALGAPHRVANRTGAADRGDRGVAPTPVHRAGDRRAVEMPLSTVSGILTRIGMGSLGRLGAGAGRSAMSANGQASWSTSTSRSSGGSSAARGIASPAARDAAAMPPGRLSTPPDAAQQDRLGVRPCRDRRRHPPGLRRSPARRTGRHRSRVHAPRTGLLRQLRHRRRARDHRQRIGLPIRDPRDRLPSTRDPAPAHPAAPPTDQRQGRTLHPHDARRLGLRRDLPHQPRTHRGP